MNQTAVKTIDAEGLELLTMPEQVEQLAKLGLTMKQIAGCIGYSRAHLYRLKDSKRDIRDALKRGRAKGLSIVTNALYTSALEGNVTAQIFYLKNRSPNEWRDRRELTVEPGGINWVINASPRLTEDEWRSQHNLIEQDSQDPNETA